MQSAVSQDSQAGVSLFVCLLFATNCLITSIVIHHQFKIMFRQMFDLNMVIIIISVKLSLIIVSIFQTTTHILLSFAIVNDFMAISRLFQGKMGLLFASPD